MRPRYLKGLTLIIVLIGYFNAYSQKSKWQFDYQLNFGVQVFLFQALDSKKHSFPGLRGHIAGSARAAKKNFLLSYGPSLSIYTKTIGANLNPLVSDWQIDFTNSFAAGVGWGKPLDYSKPMRTLHNGDYYNLSISREGAAMIGSNFILNNHGRNQVVGSINLNIKNFTVNYYNDGGIPLEWLPISDKFDRYWTGGLGLLIHNSKGFNCFEAGFDQFTGYKPLLYELSNLIGIRVPSYDGEINLAEGKVPNLNTAGYYAKFKPDIHFGLDFGVVGSLQGSKGNYWGLQDNIHRLFKIPFHPNNDINRFFIGGSFKN